MAGLVACKLSFGSIFLRTSIIVSSVARSPNDLEVVEETGHNIRDLTPEHKIFTFIMTPGKLIRFAA